MVQGYSSLKEYKIFVEDAPRKQRESNSFYQSNFKISLNGPEQILITVLANQPVYACGPHGFELAPKELAEIMCYSKFKIKKIIFFSQTV
ncbi:hypothetical protein ES703_107653 [subsurface metagenome]